VIDVVGAVDDANSLDWVIASPGSIPTGTLGKTQVIADLKYKESLLTNGGKLSENKNFNFDSRNRGEGLYNLETEKVLTYTSHEGAHMAGEEALVLDIAGNWANVENQIRCVFASSSIDVPAFCNIVSAKSAMTNVNTAQISTKGIVRAVTDSINNPTEMSYYFAVTPDSLSGSGTADGTFRTDFAGSVMEARNIDDYRNASGDAEPYYSNTWNKTAAERTWKDSTTVTGGIRNFRKIFGDPSYQSGFSNFVDVIKPPILLAPDSSPSSINNDETSTNDETSPLLEAQAGTIVIKYYDYFGNPKSAPFILTGAHGRTTGWTPITYTNMPAGYYVAKFNMCSASGRLTAGGTLNLNAYVHP
jgi:hypothetical protein